MKALTPKQFARGREIARELTALKAELGSLTMFSTVQALDTATRRIGYELAERSPHPPAPSYMGN